MLRSCVCCTVRGDLIKALTTLMKRGKKFDHVLIETTGLADPAPVAFVRALCAARGGRIGGLGSRRCAWWRGAGATDVRPRADFCAACRCPQTFFINQEVGDFYRIDSILCLADAKHVREHLNVRAPAPGSARGKARQRWRITRPGPPGARAPHAPHRLLGPCRPPAARALAPALTRAQHRATTGGEG